MSAALEFEKAGRRSDYLLLEKRQLFHTMRAWARCNPLFYASTGIPKSKANCGGLAETLGDQWCHYSPKGVGNTKKERQLYFVTGFAAVSTVLVAAGYDFAVAGLTLSRIYSYTVDLFLIAIIPVAMYAFLGGKIWCRYWCPVVCWMNLVGKKISRFRIFPDKHRCIACNLCTRHCVVGVDVMKFALKGDAFGMWNYSCIGCGIYVQICPTDALRFGHHQLVTLPTAPPLKHPHPMETNTRQQQPLIP